MLDRPEVILDPQALHSALTIGAESICLSAVRLNCINLMR
jgi:hypothetical protein